jgi:short subunit dehydrogenase-like uncharacterized protein
MWMIYGANGFTGELVARHALRAGQRPLLAGRNRAEVAALAGELGLEHRAFPLDDPDAVRRELSGVRAVLHCAGPFSKTSEPMVKACLATGAHYLDITGEIAVFEAIFARDAEARAAGVTLLPGVGFDVVPSDCVAALLAQRLPGASELILALRSHGGTVSRGTLRTMFESLGEPTLVRRGGKIESIPTASEAMEIPFASGARLAMAISWGDVATAWRTTAIPDIRVYSTIHPKRLRTLRRLAPLLPATKYWPLRPLLSRAAALKKGPDVRMREKGRVEVWGRARRDDGRTESLSLTTPEAYHFTAVAAVEAAMRVCAGGVPVGALTPSQAFGSDFCLTLPGCQVSAED